jgi:AcrR family transcriptional regulator
MNTKPIPHRSSKQRFSSDQVIGAAFKLLREKGQDNVVARAIAAELGASTMPIYSHIKSKQKLIQELLSKAFDLLSQYMYQKRTGDFWIDWGVGYVLFALEETHLFNLILREFTPGEANSPHYCLWVSVLKQAQSYDGFAGLAESQIEMIVLRRYIFNLGLATYLSKAPDLLTEEQIVEMVRGTSSALIEGAQSGCMQVVK